METRRLLGRSGPVRVGALLVAALAGPVAGQVLERVSVSSSGVQGNNTSDVASISADGRFVAFESLASNLVSGDTNGFTDVFVRDRQNATTERVSVDSSGTQADSTSMSCSISADGRYVAFQSYATNLVSGDTNGRADIFVRDRQTGTTERVSVDSSGAQGNNHSYVPAISADGRYVAFYSRATNLVSGDTNVRADIFVRDRQSGTTERVSVDSSGAQGNGDSLDPSISADGRYVAFHSKATNLVAGDTNAHQDVFVHDRQSGTTERVSVDSNGAQGDLDSRVYGPSISADGRYVAFYSEATNLVSGDRNGVPDAFVRDRQSGTTERVDVSSSGVAGNRGGSGTTVSADGRYAGFTSNSTTLDGMNPYGFWDSFVRDRLNGTTERVTNGDDQSTEPSFSADGRCLVFTSRANDLISGDTNFFADVFVLDRCVTATLAVFPGDGINADFIAPVGAFLGSSWSAPLTIGHAHGAGGPLLLTVRTKTTNGANFHSPLGGRLTEVLVGGPLLASLTGSHNGVSGDVPPQTIPAQFSLAGLTWAAQYTVIGGGFGDLSLAVSGTVGCH